MVFAQDSLEVLDMQVSEDLSSARVDVGDVFAENAVLYLWSADESLGQ